MSSPISAIVSSQPADTPAFAPAATQRALPPEPSADTIKLSEYAQVNQLKSQGQNTAEIAAILGVPVSTVDSDLAIVANVTASLVDPSAVSASAATSDRST